ncbi:MAG TPA: hypothetical protein VNL91_09905, partial [Thermoanaerobaculia bacterium]|nr:hypothetical protein [Thermoanaerobaculia bacterium]
MSDGAVSVVLPLAGRTSAAVETRGEIERYLESTGFEWEIVAVESSGSEGYGTLLRRAVGEAKGSTIVVVDPELPYPISTIGDAVAMVRSGATDVVFATTEGAGDEDRRYGLVRWLLVPILPDPSIRLKAFSADAARLVVGESKLAGGGCDLELAFLANKYGFRIERLHVA